MLDPDFREKVDLFISARDLPKVQTLRNSEPSPFAALFAKDIKTDKFVRFATTSVIKDSKNPDWILAITVDYLFEVIQEIIVKIYDKEGHHPLEDESKHTFLGECSFYLGSLMCSNSQKMECKLSGGRNTGTVLVRGEAQANSRDVFCVTFSARKLANKEGFFSTSDPFLVISRINEDGGWTQVWHNDRINNNLNPCWAPARIPMTTLCNGDPERPLKIEIFDYEKSGKHHFMGQVETSVTGMVKGNGMAMFVLEPELAAKKKGYTNSGTLTATNVMVEAHPTFADFVTGGCEISLVVAVDFTASNGSPSDPSSLHFIHGGGAYNPYQQAILAVASVLETYDTDKKYPVYGFGAKVVQPNGQLSVVQHCFPVYGGGLEVQGVDGILQAYHECLTRVNLSGPTLFGPLIAAATSIAAAANCSQARQKYTVLLVLTDGEINDMEATKQALLQAAQQPLSVIIVGVGSADFSNMKLLDRLVVHLADRTPRDIVQFVAFNEYASKGPNILGAKVLAQIPEQILQYMAMKHIKPNARKG